jgi:type IV pilus assembly protein PilE
MRGFSLIELMIVVAIIALIATIAYPSYQNQVQKANRTEAKARLTQGAQLMERFYSDNNTYFIDASAGKPVVGTASTAAGLAALYGVSGSTVYSSPDNQPTSQYTLAITTSSSNAFTLTATPRPGYAQAADTKCAAITLTNTGVRGITGTGAVKDCW